MERSEYRKQVEERARQAQEKREEKRAMLRPPQGLGLGAADRSELEVGMEIVENDAESEERRVQALDLIGQDILQDKDLINRLLDIVKDPSKPGSLRLAAIQVFQAASFLGVGFADFRGEFLDAMRNLLRDPAVGERALEILAAIGDPETEEHLVRGLLGQEPPLAPTLESLQLLTATTHTNLYPLLVQYVEGDQPDEIKEEALRLLAPYTEARPLLATVYADKAQSYVVRQMSALALKNLAPDEFATIAKQVATDGSENTDLRATSLSVLARAPQTAPRGMGLSADDDTDFENTISQVRDSEPDSPLGKAADRYLQKRGR
jgi:hypothetical protein